MNILKLSLLSLALPFSGVVASKLTSLDQTVLDGASSDTLPSIIWELKRAEIIPTVIDDFSPKLALTVSWPSGQSADLGNTIEPDKVKDVPNVTLSDLTSSSDLCTSDATYAVILTDPDAPSRENPKWSEMCHWIVTNVTLSTSNLDVNSCRRFTQELEDVIAWKPPAPPPKTGKHRYVFLAFAAANATSQPLDLSKPSKRKHWGTGTEGQGVRQWAKENELVPIAANFMYSQHNEQ